MSDFLWPHGLQHTRPPCPSPTTGVYSNSCLLSWIGDAIYLILCCHFAFNLSNIGVFSNESTLHIRWPKYWSLGFSISPSSSGLIFFRITGLIFCPRKAQETSTTPQFKSINSSALSLLYGSTLISVHDYWKNHSFDYMDICWQSDVSAFNMLSTFVIEPF